jgi:diguanylate cyclase (GGDEF)-like protein
MTMTSRGYGFFTVASDDPSVRWRARNALLVLTGVFVAGTFLTVLNELNGAHEVATTMLGVTLASGLAVAFIKSGRVGLGLAIFFVAPQLGQAISMAGRHDARLGAILILAPIALAGSMLPPRGIIAVAVFSVSIGVGCTLAFPPREPITTTEIFLCMFGLLVAILLSALLGVSGLQQEMRRSEKSSRALADLNADLERRVAERTEELQEALNQQRALITELAENAVRDPLTGLHNRRFSDHELPIMIAAGERYRHPVAVALADVDNFKQINDGYSYEVGDEVLRRFAGILNEVTRATDRLTRHGGEEFLIAMPESTVNEAAMASERIRRAVETHPWSQVAPDLRVTVSIGVSDTYHTPGLYQVLEAADRAVHEAKRSGRNRVIAVTTDPGTAEQPNILMDAERSEPAQESEIHAVSPVQMRP